MLICRMLTPGLLASLMRAESWVDHEDGPSEKEARSDQAGTLAQDSSSGQCNGSNKDYITKTEQAIYRSLYLS